MHYGVDVEVIPPVRPEVEEFARLGPLPDEGAPESLIAAHQSALAQIKRPLNDNEALLLLGLFGPDDCFGLAWTLLHLIESAPREVPLSEPPLGANEWHVRLWQRSQRR